MCQKVYNRVLLLSNAIIITVIWDLILNLGSSLIEISVFCCRCFLFFFVFSVHCIKQTDYMLQWVCSSVIDHGGRQNVVNNISDSLVYGSCATSLFYHCGLLLNRCMATWNLFAAERPKGASSNIIRI